jgi:hypothetical protein
MSDFINRSIKTPDLEGRHYQHARKKTELLEKNVEKNLPIPLLAPVTMATFPSTLALPKQTIIASWV